MREQFLRGMLYTAIGKYANLVTLLLINIVLSRLLTPVDFGVVAAVTVFVIFINQFASAGLGPAVVQRQDLSEAEIGHIFNFSLLFAAACGVVMAGAGWGLEWFYGDVIYRNVSWALSAGVALQGACVVPQAVLLRAKDFRTVNMVSVVASFGGGLVGVGTALVGAGVYALVVQTVVTGMLSLGMLLRYAHLKPSRGMSRAAIGKVWKFAGNQLAFNVVNYFARNTDNLLVGRFMGPAALGAYSKAYQLLLYPNQVLLGIITPVLQPVLAEHQDDVKLIRRTYLQIFHVMALIGFPLSAFLCLASHEVIFCLFGDQWGAAVVPFAILATTVWIQMTLSSTGGIFQARNKADRMFQSGLISAVILVIGIVIGILTGSLVGLATSLAITFGINWVVNYALFMPWALNSSMIPLFGQMWRPLIVGMASAAPVVMLNAVWSVPNPWLGLAGKGVAWLAVTVGAAMLLGEHRAIRSLTRRKPKPADAAP